MPVVCGTASGAFLAECPPRQTCDALATVTVETLRSSSLLLVRLQAEVDGAAINGTVQVLTCGCSQTWQVVGPTCSMPTWGAWVSLCVCVLLVSYCLWLGLRLLQQLLTSAPSLLQALLSPPSSPRALGYALSNEGGLMQRSHSGSEDSHQFSEGSGEPMSTTQHLAQMAVQHGMTSTRGVPIMPGQAPMVSLRATSKWPAGLMLLLTIQGIVCLLLFGLLPLVPLAWFGLMLLILEAVKITMAVFETMTLLRIMQDVLIIARRMRFVPRHIHAPIMLTITLVNILAFAAHRVWGVPHILSELLVLICSVGPLFLLHRFTFNSNFSSPPLRHPSNAVHPSEEQQGGQDGRPGLMRQESASDFWRRRLFSMARDRLAHILPPMAVVLGASVFVTLLYMGTLNPGMHLPIQVPMTVLAWARVVLAVQIIKIRSIVCAPKAAAAAANARLHAVQRQLSRRRNGRRQPCCVRLWLCLGGLACDVSTYLVWMLNPVDDYNSATSAAMHRQSNSMRGAFARTLQLPFNMSGSHASSSDANNETNGREHSEGGGSTGPTVMSTSGRLQQLMSTSGRLRQMLGSSGRTPSEGAVETDADLGQAAVDEEAAAAHYVFTTIMSRNENNNLSAIFESRNSESSSRPSSMGSENDPADTSNGIMGGLVNELQRID